MQSNRRTVLPDSVEIVLPPGWIDVPVEISEQQRFVETVLHAAEESDQRWSTADRRQLELVVAQMSALARSQNVIVASTYIAPGDGDDEKATVIVAGLIITAVDRSALGTDVPLVGELLVSGLSSLEGIAARSDFDDIEPPSLVTVRGDECVRLRRLKRLSDAQQSELKLFEESYLVPVALGDGLIVLQFSTINFEYAKQFSELFEKVAGTLRILYPDDPTFEDELTPTNGDEANPTEAVD